MRWPSLIAALLACAAASYPPIDSPLNDGNSWERILERRATNASAWPYAPLKTSGRDIVDNRGQKVTWAGVNWPLSGETMIPEGLEWKSAADILDDIKSVGWNYIRMGYAIEMIDEVYSSAGSDISLEVALIMGLGYENGTKVTKSIVDKNPQWTAQTTRFEVWSSIAELAFARGIYIAPDVHVGKAQWCCSHTDGNAWFDDINFNTTQWLRGISYVAGWALNHPNVVAMSLRNELRDSYNTTNTMYNWQTLVGNMTAGADAIHAANEDVLILWSGMQYDQDLSALTSGSNLLSAPCYKCAAVRDASRRSPEYFTLDDHAWADKLVWELHLYGGSEDIDTGDCNVIRAALYKNGFNALGIEAPEPGCGMLGGCVPAVQQTPVILSEFGHAQDALLYNDTLQNCLKDWTLEHDVSWMMWALAGSYRIRSGVQGFNDTWGLTDATWSGWQDLETIEGYWKPWIAAMNVTRSD